MSLIAKDEFVGLDNVVHLAAGGESPMLRSHMEAITRFITDKGLGETARARQSNVVASVQELCSRLFSVPSEDIAFLSSASEGINVVVYGLDWKQGDNIVVADVEFGSGIFPWTKLQEQGVEIRVVKHQNWKILLEDIDAAMDDRTRVVLMSHVSMFTGQRIALPELSRLVRGNGAALVLDATHAAGVVPVDASLADIMVSSCYKWMLGVHGTAVFYHNKETFPELKVPFLGWNSVSASGGWEDPLQMTMHASARGFVAGNQSYLSLYILENALRRTEPLTTSRIEQHVLILTAKLRQDLEAQGWEIMTPASPEERAGNICISADRVEVIAHALKEQNILVWGTHSGESRIRISPHLYNNADDVEACVRAMRKVCPAAL